jgi:hypothetical protein
MEALLIILPKKSEGQPHTYRHRKLTFTCPASPCLAETSAASAQLKYTSRRIVTETRSIHNTMISGLLQILDVRAEQNPLMGKHETVEPRSQGKTPTRKSLSNLFCTGVVATARRFFKAFLCLPRNLNGPIPKLWNKQVSIFTLRNDLEARAPPADSTPWCRPLMDVG